MILHSNTGGRYNPPPGAEAQRTSVTCIRSYSKSVEEARFEPRQSDFRGHFLTMLLDHLPEVCTCIQEIKQLIQDLKEKARLL